MFTLMFNLFKINFRHSIKYFLDRVKKDAIKIKML